jgi:hypothetical protein
LREDANFGPYDEGGKDLRRGDGCEKEMPEDKEEKRTRVRIIYVRLQIPSMQQVFL